MPERIGKDLSDSECDGAKLVGSEEQMRLNEGDNSKVKGPSEEFELICEKYGDLRLFLISVHWYVSLIHLLGTCVWSGFE